MTYFLRNNINESLVDLEQTYDNFHVVINIKAYSKMLLSLSEDQQYEFIKNMHDLQELRAEWFEGIHPETLTLRDFIERRLDEVSNRWALYLIID